MSAPRWLNDEEYAAWRAYLDSTRLLLEALDRQLVTDAGLSFTDYELLVHLSEAPGQQLRMRDLAGATLSTRSGVTRAVTRLQRAGWVRRVEVAQDHRGTMAELTAAGKAKLAATAPGHVAAVRRYMFDVLTVAQIRNVRAVGLRMKNAAADPR